MSYSVCVMGLGTVGLPTATYLQKQGSNVVGYDIDPRAVAKAGKQIEATSDLDKVPSDTQVFVICVSTKVSGDQPEVASVYDVCRKITTFEPEFVAVESTVPVGTCRNISRSVFRDQTKLVHVPHRYWELDQERRGVSQLRVMGAIDKSSMPAAREFYKEVDIPLLEVESIEVAELCKVAENAYRYVQIAFAEELRAVCQRSRIDFKSLRQACNSKWNVDLPEARDGIGGTCLPKDIRYLVSLARKSFYEPDLLLGAIGADRKYLEQLAEAVVSA